MSLLASSMPHIDRAPSTIAFAATRSAVVFGNDRVLCEGVIFMLEHFGIDTEAHKLGCLDDPNLVLLVADSEAELAEELGKARTLHPSASVIAVVPNADKDLCRVAYAGGAAGVIDRNSTPAAMYDTIGRVFEGEQVFPVAIDHQATAAEMPETRVPIADGCLVSAREFEILQGIAGGMTNREIADALDACPVRTKSQVRSLLRKIGVTNRTQAALWAESHGVPKFFG